MQEPVEVVSAESGRPALLGKAQDARVVDLLLLGRRVVHQRRGFGDDGARRRDRRAVRTGRGSARSFVGKRGLRRSMLLPVRPLARHAAHRKPIITDQRVSVDALERLQVELIERCDDLWLQSAFWLLRIKAMRAVSAVRGSFSLGRVLSIATPVGARWRCGRQSGRSDPHVRGGPGGVDGLRVLYAMNASSATAVQLGCQLPRGRPRCFRRLVSHPIQSDCTLRPPTVTYMAPSFLDTSMSVSGRGEALMNSSAAPV